VWAPPADNPYAKIIDEAIEAHGQRDVTLSSGPSHYVYSGKEAFREAMERAGFDGESMIFKLHMIEWVIPSADFAFEAERYAGVRTAGLLALQTPERLERIRRAIHQGVQRYAKGESFAVPKPAYVVAATKRMSR
jgi:hypothetical protein